MSDDHTHVQEFFGARAADWDTRFPDDGPVYAAAVTELGLREGDRVLDAGCGTGRALPPLRDAVGPSGVGPRRGRHPGHAGGRGTGGP